MAHDMAPYQRMAEMRQKAIQASAALNRNEAILDTFTWGGNYVILEASIFYISR